VNVHHTVDVTEAEIIRAIQKYVASKTNDGANWQFDVNVRWRAHCAVVEARPAIPTLTQAVGYADCGLPHPQLYCRCEACTAAMDLEIEGHRA
jgi:hypothetical protein